MSTLHQLLLVIGLVGVPVALLGAGHRLRRASLRRQHAFWGALIGHLLAGAASLTASLAPPTGWQSTDLLRGALGVWALVALPLIGASIGTFTGSRRSPR